MFEMKKRGPWVLIFACGCIGICFALALLAGATYWIANQSVPTLVARTPTPMVATTPTARPAKTLAPIPSDRATCEALGGRWARIGLAPGESCNLPTSDAGKICADSSECESLCLADLSRADQDRVARTKTPLAASGKCAPWRVVVGCIAVVENGMVKTILCID